jgi:hypothetical protein
MSTRHLFAAAARASAAVDSYTLTTGRLVGSVGALVALAGVVVGGLALARAGRAGAGRRGAVVALVAGLAGMATGALVVAATEGGPGTGYGIVGGFAALAIGLVAAVLGGLALARSRRAA